MVPVMRLSKTTSTVRLCLQVWLRSGPRYCPSIEDKIVRFADKERHQLFLEPEGRNTEKSMFKDFQPVFLRMSSVSLVHSIKGLENAEMMRTGYAIEYDMVLASSVACNSGNQENLRDFSLLVRQMERQVTKKLLAKGIIAGYQCGSENPRQA